eukprot:1786820-Pleurochrysis_carterae.AAC.1
MLHLAMTDARTDGSINYENPTVKSLLSSSFDRAHKNYTAEFSQNTTKDNAIAYLEVMKDQDNVLTPRVAGFADKLKREPVAISQILDFLHCMARGGNRSYPVNYAINQYLQYVKKRVSRATLNINDDMIRRLSRFLDHLNDENNRE